MAENKTENKGHLTIISRRKKLPIGTREISTRIFIRDSKFSKHEEMNETDFEQYQHYLPAINNFIEVHRGYLRHSMHGTRAYTYLDLNEQPDKLIPYAHTFFK